MSEDAVQRAHWGDFKGQNWAGLCRLSTEEVEGELDDDGSSGMPHYRTGKDIKSTDEQELDARTHVEARGGNYIHTYMEPDTSAWKRRRTRLPDGQVVYRVIRPVYEGALKDLQAGLAPNGMRLDGLIVYDLDRLTRDARHLEDAIDTVVQFHRPIVDTTGSLDLLTENGRTMARVMTAVSNKSSADTSRRVRRKHKAMQREGIPAGGPRPYGWEEDRRTVRESEAVHLRSAAVRLLEGSAVWSTVVSAWNREGLRTARGHKWTHQSLQAVLGSPRICGYRAMTQDDWDPETQKETRRIMPVIDKDGNPVKGQHDAILTVEQWQGINLLIEASSLRGHAPNSRKYLSSGTLRCGKNECGTKLRAMLAGPSQKKPPGYFFYQCPAGTQGPGCGGVRIPGPETDELVRKLVIAQHQERASKHQEAQAAMDEQWPQQHELTALQEDMDAAKAARRSGTISAERYYQDLGQYEARKRDLLKSRSAWQRKTKALMAAPVDIAKMWEKADLPLQRSYLENAFSAIVVLPVGKGSRVPLRDRLLPIPAEV